MVGGWWCVDGRRLGGLLVVEVSLLRKFPVFYSYMVHYLYNHSVKPTRTS